MLCSRPYRQGVAEYGCGQCMPCRINRRRLWTGRLMLEEQQHQASCFVTLTYDAEHLPVNGSVDPVAVQLFLKRFRKAVEPLRIRFFAVGEYGSVGERPHYHLLLFGFSPGDSHALSFRKEKRCQCVICSCWSFGAVDVGTVTAASAAYVCGYLVKSCTNSDDRRLNGRHPEFARMSLRPGIGGLAVPVLASAAGTYGGAVYVANNCDVFRVHRVGGVNFPLGRYLAGKLRIAAGYSVLSEASSVLSREVSRAVEARMPGFQQKRSGSRSQQVLNAISRVRIIQSKRRV